MTEQEIPLEEEVKEEVRTATDRISVAGSDLIKTVQGLLREAAVRKITVQDKNGRTLLEIPLYAGVLGALFIGSWTVLALIAAWFAEVSILIERDVQSDEEAPTAFGEAVSRTVSKTKTGLGSAVGGVAHAASDLAKRAADSLEGRMSHVEMAQEEMAQAEEAAEAIKEAAAAAVEPRQCAALTKSGARCKRAALPGSDYCSTHQPK
jgi:methyl-accepting chemotaxis protein